MSIVAPPWLRPVPRWELEGELANLPCLFYERTVAFGGSFWKRGGHGVLRQADCSGSNGVVAVFGERSAGSFKVVLLTRSNIAEDGAWHIADLMQTAVSNVNRFRQLVRNAQKVNTEPIWHEWATVFDQFGAWHEFERTGNALANDVEKLGTHHVYRIILNLLDPPPHTALSRTPVHMGPQTRAKTACMQRPRVFREGTKTLIEWRNYPQMCVVYEDQAAATELYEEYLAYQAKNGHKKQRTDVHGGTSTAVIVSLKRHIQKASKAHRTEWLHRRDFAVAVLKEDAEYVMNGCHICKRAKSGPRKGQIVWSVPRDFTEHPRTLYETYLVKVVEAVDLAGTLVAPHLSGALKKEDLPRCIGLEEGEDYHKYNPGRKLIKLTESDLRHNVAHPGYEQAADDMIALVLQLYERLGWDDRSKQIESRVKVYTSPLCSNCPFGYESPANCLHGTGGDRTRAYRVADVIRHNIEARKLAAVSETEDEDEIDDAVFASVNIPEV
jgi:hypothetical protein